MSNRIVGGRDTRYMRDQLLVDDPSLVTVVFGLQSTANRRPSRDGCLDEIGLAELVEGRAEPASRKRYVAHLAACGHCREQLASLAELLADQSVNVARRHLVPVRGRTAAVGGLLAVAATTVLVLGWPRFAVEPLPHRAPTITATAAPLPISPIGAVASAASLQWAPVSGADRYRVTLYDAAGAPLYEALTPDTSVALPDSLALARGRSYLWQVEARTGPDRWSASEMAEFRMVRPAP